MARERAAAAAADEQNGKHDARSTSAATRSLSAALDHGNLGPLAQAVRTAELERKLDALHGRAAELEAEQNANEKARHKDLPRARVAPRDREKWAWMGLKQFAEHGTAEPGGAKARVAIAYKAGWIVERPSTELRGALAALDHQTLWAALHFDGNDPHWALQVKRDLKCRREHEKLAVARFASGCDIEPALLAIDPKTATSVIADLRSKAEIARLDRQMVESFAAATERESSSRAIAQLRGKVVARLLAILKSVDASWSIPKMAQLVLSSSKDFTKAPCPQLAAKYDNNVAKLADALKKAIASGKKHHR